MTYRILSLDGGGIRGVIAARILIEIERQIDQPLNEYFDLIAGTSTGAILAGAIAIGRKSQDILNLYRTKGQRIFPYNSRLNLQRLGLVKQYGLSAPKYSDQGLIAVLKEELGHRPLADIGQSPRLLITSYDTIKREPLIFKSWQQYKDTVKTPLWEACTASASAPSYFPAHLLQTEERRYSLIDGGVGANNPSACAVAEALRLDYPIKEISMLSIGTGSSSRSLPWEKVRGWGILQWAWNGRIVEVSFDAPSDIHNYITREVMSDPDADGEECSRYLRMQPEITNDKMDDASPENIANLEQIAEDYLARNQHLVKQFLEKSC
ncbi:MAG: patatin-like phospholipase family protein [Kastovskya adunca ATA6-11-RM4]|nr:patatin-like phospholipase family protein [Kastovskya adunca ATA6-11-RM4]